MCLMYSKEVHNNTKMMVLVVKNFTYLKVKRIGQTPSSRERYLVITTLPSHTHRPSVLHVLPPGTPLGRVPVIAIL